MIPPELIDIIENAVCGAGYEVLGGTGTSLVVRASNYEADFVIRIEKDNWA